MPLRTADYLLSGKLGCVGAGGGGLPDGPGQSASGAFAKSTQMAAVVIMWRTEIMKSVKKCEGIGVVGSSGCGGC